MKPYFTKDLDLEYLLQYVKRPILIINDSGIITFSNEKASAIFKRNVREIIGKNIYKMYPSVKFDTNLMYLFVDEESYFLLQSPIAKEGNRIGTVFIVVQEVNHLLKQTTDKYEDALINLSECIMGVDENGCVNFFSRSYANLLGISNPKSVIGKHCTDVVDNSRMHIIVKTGKTEIGHLMNVNEKTVIATRIPIFKEGKVIGAIGKIMFHDVDEFKALANQIQEMESKIKYYEREIQRIQGAKYSFQSIVGNSIKIQEVKNNAQKVAKSRSTVLLKGETGTGKELFAHAIHLASPRSAGPFIPVNCAAIPKDLLEAELFGYEAGAFTGANKEGKPGKFEMAQNGTLFLDEIGDMPLDMQAKLLRILEGKEVERVGGTVPKNIDVRIIAATNKSLWDMIQEGNFREDLYYRLNVFMLDIPPLRERKEDITPIAELLIENLSKEMGIGKTIIDENVKKVLLAYHWPGNIRELENVLERSLNVMEVEGVIQRPDLPVYLGERKQAGEKNEVYSLKAQVEKTEKRAIRNALDKSKGNKLEAADLLGIHRASLYRKIEKYNL